MSWQVRVMSFGEYYRFGAFILLLAALIANSTSTAVANGEQGTPPDLVITEDSQLALKGRSGSAVLGSCQTADPLWKGKIALKNIGATEIVVEEANVSQQNQSGGGLQLPLDVKKKEELIERAPHVRIYVPNNIELQDNERLTHNLKELGQELLELEIGEGVNKCRNYSAPPVFDSRLSGRPGRIVRRENPAPSTQSQYNLQIKRLQTALIEKGYSLRYGADGDYGPDTIIALQAFFKDSGKPPPAKFNYTPLPAEVVTLLLDALGVGDSVVAEEQVVHNVVGSDECIKGVNYVPVYIEIDPLRGIQNENRSNNRVQFTVEIDCTSVAR